MPNGQIPVYRCNECDAWFATRDAHNGHQTKHEREARDELAYGVTD